MTNEFVNNFTSASDIAYTAFRDIEGDVAEQKNAKCIPFVTLKVMLLNRKTQSVFQPVL